MPKLLPNRKRLLAATFDIVVAGLSLWVSLALRLGLNALPDSTLVFLSCAAFAAIAGLAFSAFGLAKGMWRFASLADMRAIVLSSTVTVLAFMVVEFLLNRLETIPRSVPLLAWFVMIVLLSGPRLLYRLVKDNDFKHVGILSSTSPRMKLLLVAGTTEANEIIRRLHLESNRHYQPMGILSPVGSDHGRTVRGIPILGDANELERIVGDLRRKGSAPDAIVVTFPSKHPEAIRSIVSRAAEFGIVVKRVSASDPSMSGHGDVTLGPLTLDDLLSRPPVKLNIERFREFLHDRVVLITGAGGSIGSEITRKVASFEPRRLVLLDNSEFNLYSIDHEIRLLAPTLGHEAILMSVQNRDGLAELMSRTRPDIVFHAAALKHVPLLETNVSEAVLTNVVGTRNVADAAIRAEASAVVIISTDKAIRPSSVMGATKRIAECYCQSLDLEASKTMFITVRFGNVLGSTGSVVPLFERQIKAGGPVTVTHPEMRRYFMTIREATELVLQAAGHRLSHPNQRGGILVLDMGEPIRIVDLARTMIALRGKRLDVDIPIVFTGLRAGEKLFEELFDVAESTVPTETDGIFAASPRAIDNERLFVVLRSLESAAAKGATDQVRALLAAIVPDFSGREPATSAETDRRGEPEPPPNDTVRWSKTRATQPPG